MKRRPFVHPGSNRRGCSFKGRPAGPNGPLARNHKNTFLQNLKKSKSSFGGSSNFERSAVISTPQSSAFHFFVGIAKSNHPHPHPRPCGWVLNELQHRLGLIIEGRWSWKKGAKFKGSEKNQFVILRDAMRERAAVAMAMVAVINGQFLTLSVFFFL